MTAQNYNFFLNSTNELQKKIEKCYLFIILVVKLPFTIYQTSIRLVSSQHKHFGDLHMLRCARCVIHHVGNIIASQGFDALIYLVRTLFIAAKTSYAEVRLYPPDIDKGVSRIGAEIIPSNLMQIMLP